MNLHAQVVDRLESDPHIIKDNRTVRYRIPGNTHSADKTNFWKHVEALFGVPLPPDVGLTGNGMSGELAPTENDDWNVTGIPITPLDDNGRINPYPLAVITAHLPNGRVGRSSHGSGIALCRLYDSGRRYRRFIKVRPASYQSNSGEMSIRIGQCSTGILDQHRPRVLERGQLTRIDPHPILANRCVPRTKRKQAHA